MPKKYPLLKLSEVREILRANGFERENSVGSHEQFIAVINGVLRRVTVDAGHSEFDDFLVKSMIRQSGLTREIFYGSSKSAAKNSKINSYATLEIQYTSFFL